MSNIQHKSWHYKGHDFKNQLLSIKMDDENIKMWETNQDKVIIHDGL